MELTNIAPSARDQLYKRASISLCSNVPGQIMTGLMVNPPKPGQASFPLYHTETTEILGKRVSLSFSWIAVAFVQVDHLYDAYGTNECASLCLFRYLPICACF
jgi:hypothetical protein